MSLPLALILGCLLLFGVCAAILTMAARDIGPSRRTGSGDGGGGAVVVTSDGGCAGGEGGACG